MKLNIAMGSTAACALALLASDALADGNLAAGLTTGVVSTGAGRGAFTLGAAESWESSALGFLVYGLRGSAAGSGFVGGAPGAFARADLAIGAELGKAAWLDAGVGAEVISVRLCGALNCGRVTGIVPEAGIRLVLFGAYFDQALGLNIEAGAFYVVHSRAREGLNASISAGPLWRFGGSK